VTESDSPQERAPGLLSTMKASLRIIVAATVAAGLLGFLIASRTTEQYESRVRLHISYPDEGSEAPRDPQRRLNDLAARVTTTQVMERTAQKLGAGSPSTAQLATKVTAQPSQALDIIDVTARNGSPDGAERIATAVAAAFQEVSAEARVAAAQAAAASLEGVRSEVQERVDSTNQRLGEVRGAIEGQVNRDLAASGPEARRQALETRLATDSVYLTALAERDAALDQLRELSARSQRLMLDAAARGSEVDLTEAARTSEQPVSPRPLRYALLAGLLGLLASASAVWLRALRHATEPRRSALKSSPSVRPPSARPRTDEAS
jgi:succinoglycan biosynthesis transport protein ExoP